MGIVILTSVVLYFLFFGFLFFFLEQASFDMIRIWLITFLAFSCVRARKHHHHSKQAAHVRKSDSNEQFPAQVPAQFADDAASLVDDLMVDGVCKEGDCQNGGVCDWARGCVCPPGYSGTTCEEPDGNKATTTASPTTTTSSVTTTTIPAGTKKTTSSTGGICISKSSWNKDYLCMDHLEPLLFGCSRKKCFLQCQKGDKSYNYCYPEEQGTGTTRPCTQHQECGDTKLLCKDQCTESQLDRFDRFSARTAEPTASTYTPTTSTPSTTITTTTATTIASPTTTTTSVTTTTIPAGMKKTTASTETAKYPKDKCSRACSKIHDPVCDTKGKTHENRCLFKEASCRASQNGDKIAIAKYGKCLETAKWQKDKCSRACPKIHDPVCDTKGKTHENPCLFKEESCRARQNGDKIAIAKYGKCSETAKWQKDKCSRACSKIHDPVCDTEGKTHETRCLFM